ncbi:hypothetical protein AVEN_29698-1 [Araneus ventricosus]|uniref:Uncharacterized protein n=1 Tax=Araneus ventricosus TaxID=182803 RepID=A0A4Y2S1W7_ARAVE|nr:hypothetical protein AVEN_29698-1 [Araneus ventricosus]
MYDAITGCCCFWREKRFLSNFGETPSTGSLSQHGQPYSHTKLPKPHIKGLLRKRMLEEWQTLWKNGDTGRKIYNIMPSVSLRLTNWIREDVIFFSLSMALSLPTSNGFTCPTAIIAVVVELARHFTMPRIVPSQ